MYYIHSYVNMTFRGVCTCTVCSKNSCGGLCRTSGVKVGGGLIFEGGVLVSTYSTHICHTYAGNLQSSEFLESVAE